MKTNYILASSLLAALTFTGCQDLDTYPEGGTVTSQQKEEVSELDPTKAEAGVNAIYFNFNRYMPNAATLGAERHNDIGYPTIMLETEANGFDVVSDNNGYNWTGNGLSYQDRSFAGNECQMVWNDLYSTIYVANNVITFIKETPTSEEVLNQSYMGQALAARAFHYFLLAQLYQFNYVGHESSPCVPIVTDENISEVEQNGAPRATVQEVYDRILADLNEAISLLEAAEAAGNTRVDKRYINSSVAYGIRARVYLTMQKWNEAKADAEKAISVADAAPASIEDVSKPTFKSISETNWMWGIKINETDDVVSSGIVNWISHMGSLNYGYANFSQGMAINKKLYASIADTDVRKGWWVDEEGKSPYLTAEQQAWMDTYYTAYGRHTQVKFAPYNDVVGQSTNASDIPLMRIEEMYLIKAEAEAMGGNVGTGKSTLEDFIKTYRDPSYTCTASSAAEIQDEIFRQRRIELWGEGLIWYDIMRLNKDVDRRGAGYPNAGTIFNIPAGSDILLWRIPEKEINANKGLTNDANNPEAPLPSPVADVE